jgi:hypothetical protein
LEPEKVTELEALTDSEITDPETQLNQEKMPEPGRAIDSARRGAKAKKKKEQPSGRQPLFRKIRAWQTGWRSARSSVPRA